MRCKIVICLFSLSLPCTICLADPVADRGLADAVQFQDLEKIPGLIAKGANVNFKENGRPLLGWAAQSGNVQLVQALLKAGANPNIADDGVGHTPLMRAIETQFEDIVRALLAAKADPNAKTPAGKSCLQLAVESRKPGIVQALIDAKANVAFVSEEGDSLVLVAAQDGMPESLEIIRILAKAGAPMDVSNIIYTPLSYAVQQSNSELVKTLLAAGANPNAKTKDGKAPLHRAIDNMEILSSFLQTKGLDLNPTDSYGDTPLHNAIRNGQVDAAKALLKAGADASKKDATGADALQIAEGSGQQEILEILKPKQAAASNQADIDPKSWQNCTIVDAAKRQMEIHGLLQAQVDAGKRTSDIFRTFGDDTKEYGEVLASNPPQACKILEGLRKKYGL